MNIQDLENYNYSLPDKLIRKVPLEVRHNSKLLIYNTSNGEIIHDIFLNLYKYLPTDSHLILNNTKVLPCRLYAEDDNNKETEIFLLMNEWVGEKDIPIMIKGGIKKEKEYKVFSLVKDNNIKLEVYRIEDKHYLKYVKNINDIIDKYGVTPIPHYLEENKGGASMSENDLRDRYQTIFASTGSSVAAPTASLHFTQEVFDKLKSKNINNNYVTLDVGRGTFSNLKDENFSDNKLHSERYYIGDDTLKILNDESAYKVAVGTTACRTIESYGATGKQLGVTDIFITPGFKFIYTDALITNFHLPRTSLMLLVEAFLRSKNAKHTVTDIYKVAIDNDYSFYSFGDAMLII